MPSLPMIQESKSPAPSPSSKFIYVVDDDPRSLAVVEDVLHAEGYLVVSFLSPQLALEVFLQTKIKPALLMTDYGMTAMNGFELIERFRRAAPDLKFILFSGQIEDFSQSEYPFKIHRFLKKPLVHSEIIKAISDAFATPVD